MCESRREPEAEREPRDPSGGNAQAVSEPSATANHHILQAMDKFSIFLV